MEELFKIVGAIGLMVLATVCPPLCLLVLWIGERQKVMEYI